MLLQYPLDSVRRRRNALNPPMTQQQLADAAGISQSTLNKVENGSISPSYDTVRRIFEVLEEKEHNDEKKAKEVMHSPVIFFDENDKVEAVAEAAKSKAISQFPVLKNGKITGSVSTKALIGAGRHDKLTKFIEPELPTFGPETPISALVSALKYAGAVLITEKGRILGIITPEDLL